MKVLRKLLAETTDPKEILIARYLLNSRKKTLRGAAELCSEFQDAAAKVQSMLLAEADRKGGWKYSLSCCPDDTFYKFAEAVAAAREVGCVDDAGREILIGQHQTGE